MEQWHERKVDTPYPWETSLAKKGRTETENAVHGSAVTTNNEGSAEAVRARKFL